MSRALARDAAVLVVGGLIGAGGLYVAQQGPSAAADRALALYSGLMGGDGHAHAEGPKTLAAADDHTEGDDHAHGKEATQPKDDGHGHGEDDGHSKDDDDGHGSGEDDGHGHDAPKPRADAGNDGHGHGAELPEGVVAFDDARLRAAGIALGEAGASTLREELQLNGIVRANQEAVVQVTPRFPGIVRTLARRLGDEVRKGDLLAVVESNQSLTTYDLKAPMAGVVTERQASLGEYVSEQKPAFVITDLSTLWVDFSVYRRDLARVAVGGTVRIDPEDGGEPIEATISYLSPIGAADTQSAVARAVIPNDGRFRPGLFATGAVATAEQPVPLAVSLDAVQSLEGRDVVFVREGDRFAARDVTLGRRDGRTVEVVTGLKGGESYASKNSFVVKAELAKGSASHEH
ncbi:divalent metal ion exporter adaptor subunit IhpB [Methylopila musalis]|uniref:Divalent metal ion exporter adaptor subunit IhpB n=1 Tax=Methylopila musalis TaxID=1134781 RepID=A0ABW3Z4I7_9HYPH